MIAYDRAAAYGRSTLTPGAQGLRILAVIGGAIALALRAERSAQMVAAGRWTDESRWLP